MASYTFQRASQTEVFQIAQIYDQLNDYLEANTNYPNWKKGVYPTLITAQTAFEQQTLFTLKHGDSIVASVILNHLPEEAYQQVDWGIKLDDHQVFIIHTCIVHPSYVARGIGSQLMQAIYHHALSVGVKAIRLDVSIYNQPAISLYEKAGYSYITTVDLGLEIIDLKWFRLYQLII